MAWFFQDEAAAYTQARQDALATAEAIVPATSLLEVANTLVMGEWRRRSTEAQAATWLRYLRALPEVVDEKTAVQTWGNTLRLARSHGLSAYDAACLELALCPGMPLATPDGRLKAAAKAAGVREFAP
jgi:predicted nucleic acid-binding protein